MKRPRNDAAPKNKHEHGITDMPLLRSDKSLFSFDTKATLGHLPYEGGPKGWLFYRYSKKFIVKVLTNIPACAKV